MNNNELSLLKGLKKKAKAVIPEGGEVWLYGSRLAGMLMPALIGMSLSC